MRKGIDLSYLYVVRCNFSSAELEAEWNEWYNGPKLRRMLDKPFFSSGQRFRASSVDAPRTYLALWGIETPDAFATPQYRDNWGFFDWASHIADWSRDLYQLPDRIDAKDLEVPTGARLHLASFDGMSDAEASEIVERLRPIRPAMVWAEVVGLDRQSPWLGLHVSAEDDPQFVNDQSLGVGLEDTFFEPISPLQTA